MNCQKMKQHIDINSRKIVIHHTHLIDDIMSLLNDNDLVFFDDCLYSQYLFIHQNKQQLQAKNINCILGFSTQIYRTTQIPIIENSAILHDRVHADDNTAFGGFMSLSELRELLCFDNIHLAGHSAKHLELEKITTSKLQQSQIFNKDITLMKKDLDALNLNTDIFVYPYAYDDFPCAETIVRINGFRYIFAGKNSKRIEIETLI